MHQLVILDDRVSDWETKGEIQQGYFNPAGLFDQVTVISLWQDSPTAETISSLCFPANAQFVSLGLSRLHLAASTLGLRPFLLKYALRKLFTTTENLSPDIIRCYGESLGTVISGMLKRKLGIPFAVSLHTTPAPEILNRFSSSRDKLWRRMINSMCTTSLNTADAVIVVYSPILNFLPTHARAKAVVIPNSVNVNSDKCATRTPDNTFKILWIGRLIPGRNPREILKALCTLCNASLTIIGDGPNAEETKELIQTLGLVDRVSVIPSMPNPDLIEILPDFDALTLQTDYLELSKPVIEASLCGLPVIINQTPSASLDEYNRLPVLFVDGSSTSYAATLSQLQNDIHYWYETHRGIREAAWRHWSPTGSEKALAKTLNDAIANTLTGKNK